MNCKSKQTIHYGTYSARNDTHTGKCKGNVTLNDIQRYNLQRCCVENRSSVTCHCEDWLRTTIQATSLQVFKLKSKTPNVLPLFRIRRKSFAVTCHITLLFVATSYHGKSSEKIVDCNISLKLGHTSDLIKDLS